MEVSEQEHWEMLAALYKHGTNTKALVTELSNWGQEKVEHYIKCCRKNAKRKEKECEQNRLGDEMWLTKWLSHTRNMHILEGTFDGDARGRVSSFVPKDQGRLLSKVMLFLSEEEEHPPPSSSTDPDYKEIYRYLGQVLEGEEPSQLSQGSATMVLRMLDRVEEVATKSKYRGTLNNRLHLKPPPYITSWKGPTDEEQLEEEEDRRPECPLFTTGDEEGLTEEEEITELQKDDANYELKKQEALKKSKEVQAAVATSLTNIPGLNPYAFPQDLLIKPEYINEEAVENS
ncbi:uncharacterized protein LOC123501363 isoform X1 [Portunus trituberculatus]|uniref:uncharacterized protein LOC123501363 isoform X1 n=1 Tax=Portunus trituberculatus TaxID=210409 RepID=UPI001E1CFF6C|nr:uncharacterized protein LOC123501363 isoform X1 [Portunus trituberculatus]